MRAKFVNEKFTDEESDPIADMGIGFSFETLKPGAIIKTKRHGIAVTHNGNGHFTDYHTGMILQTDKFIMITNIRNWSDTGKYKRIYFLKFYEEKDCVEYRNNFKLTGQAIGFLARSNNMIVSKLMFNNRFEVIERGF